VRNPFHRCVAGLFIMTIALTYLRAADSKALVTAAQGAYYGKLLTLKHPYLNNKLRFNTSGVLDGESEEGTWTMNGLVHVEEMEVKSDRIVVHGTRAIATLRTEDGKLGVQPVLMPKHFEAELLMNGPVTSIDQIKQSMEQVFQQDDLARRLNEYWRAKAVVQGYDLKQGVLLKGDTSDGIYGYLGSDRPVYFSRPPVESAKAIHKGGIEYSVNARANRTQGKTAILLVINEKGQPEILHLIKDLGDQLDVQSLAGISQWRFEPATLEGKPVASVRQVQIKFSSY